ncbi:MAG: 2,4-dienoyl-CoA reductase [Candidatus Obscuribacterales bacterium]|nr:2,4-dienoyl-CoA reductase [Candidatus Obscuribacterales bacterium]
MANLTYIIPLVSFSLLGLIAGLIFAFRHRLFGARKQQNTALDLSTLQRVPPVGEKDFAGQTAIITGGGTGLGKAMALEMARRGANLVIASRNAEHLESAAQEIRALGAEVLTVELDVRKIEDVEAMVEKTLARFGKIDVLVNNAAGNFLVPAEKLTANGWNAVIGIVLNGTWHCSSAVGKVMLKQKQGTILNIVANYAWSGQPGVVHSAAAKAGVLSMTRTLAVEWGRHGIRVNAFAPGPMVTAGASANLQYNSDEAQALIASRVPLGRLTSAEEMAKYAAFLCSPQAAYINGDVLTADGGQWLPRGFLDLQDKLGA